MVEFRVGSLRKRRHNATVKSLELAGVYPANLKPLLLTYLVGSVKVLTEGNWRRHSKQSVRIKFSAGKANACRKQRINNGIG
jgi:hypothetical protein